jgi:hypothetical protein
VRPFEQTSDPGHPGDLGQWLEVTEGGADRPRAEPTEAEHGLVLVRPYEVVAHGTVSGIPWFIQAYETGPAPGGKWWEHGPVGPNIEFTLRGDGSGGGCAMYCAIPDGTHFSASVNGFGGLPDVIAWVGIASNETDHIEVRLDDGDVRRVELHPTLDGCLRMFWFFPPRGASGSIVALGADGEPLQTERLVDLDAPPGGCIGTTINGFGHQPGRPPPGWPADDTAYGPGQGPRWAEDFLLHACPFPLYVVPPDAWEGYTSLGGHGGSGTGNPPEEVRFLYVDDAGDARRGFEIVNRSPRRARRLRDEAREEDLGTWMPGQRHEHSQVWNFASRFVPPEDVRSHRFSEDAGPRRYNGRVEVSVAGQRVQAERWEWQDLPSYRRLVVALPEADLVLHAWDLADDECVAMLAKLEQLRPDTPLFDAMKLAQARTDARWTQLRGTC